MDELTADEALKRSEHRYRNLFQAMAASFWELDFFPVGDMLRTLRKAGVADYAAYFAANPKFVREMMIATRVVDVNDQAVATFGRGDKAEMLGSVEPFWPEASSPVFATAVVSAVSGKLNYACETRLRALDGRELDALFTACFPLETMNKGTLLIGVIDITESKRAQAALAQVQAEFARAARVSMLGELTASIAHEVNQPLAAIATNASAGLRWLSRPEPDVDEVRALMTRIGDDARRAAEIVARARAMAAGKPPERTAVRLNSVVEEVVAFLRHEIQHQGAQVSLDLPADLPEVMGDRTQLQQVVVNLALNALQAMAQVEAAHRLLTLRTGRAGDGAVTVAVEDSGAGIAPENAAGLFETFFTTKSMGMGMGLPICRSIVESHGGTIQASAGATGGACFTVALPPAGPPPHTKV